MTPEQMMPGQMGFLDECEYRISMGEEGRRKACKKVEDEYGLKMVVRPQMCAQCQLKSSIDEEFLKSVVMRTTRQMVNNTRLGFLRQDQDAAESAFDVAFKVFSDDPDIIATIQKEMTEAVEYGNFEHERAVRVAEKYGV